MKPSAKQRELLYGIFDPPPMCPVSVKHNKIVNMTLKLFKPGLSYEE